MHKAQIVSPILDMQVKQRSYKKHMDALVTIKPAIDTSKPPPVPRLEVYKKRVTRDRLVQLQVENDNIKMIQNIAKQRNKTKKAYKTAESFSDDDFIEDWEDQLDTVDMELASRSSNERPAPLLSDPNKVHSVKNIINDDGMEVVDENVVTRPVVVKPFGSSRKRASTSRSGLRRLNPLKKTLNHKRNLQVEEEDYNDNDVDDESENTDIDSNKNTRYNDDNKYSSDSSRSLSGDENTDRYLSGQINSESRNQETDDEDSFDRYDKVSENIDNDIVKTGRLFSENFEDFESSSSSHTKKSKNSSDTDHNSDKLTKIKSNTESNTEEMNNHTSDNENCMKNDEGFDNFENSGDDKDLSKENVENDKSDISSKNNLDDDDFNMDSIPEF